MSKIKIVDTILSAVYALVAAVKAIIKFIGYIAKLRPEPASTA